MSSDPNVKLAQNRATSLLEDLKKSKGFIHDALFWCEKLDTSHIDHSYFDHAVSTAAMKMLNDQRVLLNQLEVKLKHLQSKGLK